MNHKDILNTYGCKCVIPYMVYYIAQNFEMTFLTVSSWTNNSVKILFTLQYLQVHGEKF